MFKLFFGFIACTAFLFMGVNWFVRPLFPVIASIIPALSIWHCAGASAVLMIALLFWGGGSK